MTEEKSRDGEVAAQVTQPDPRAKRPTTNPGPDVMRGLVEYDVELFNRRQHQPRGPND